MKFTRWRRLWATVALATTVSPAHAENGPWDTVNIAGLQAILASIPADGLDPADYAADRLAVATEVSGPDIAPLADAAALRLAHDLFEGRRDLSARAGWHFARLPADYRTWLDTALAGHNVEVSFTRLRPPGAAYAGLRAAMENCVRSNADCTALRINLDRWRALPRQFGTRYLWVNIPAYRVDLVEYGRTVASHRVIVGKVGTKTPQFTTVMTGVTANPWWNVPCSIVDESIGKMVRERPAEAARKGFVARSDDHGKLVVRQKPGPDNALGRIKFEMPNPYGVYLHDTQSRGLFDKDMRAYSHGCIRTDQPEDLARRLLGPEKAGELDAALLTFATRTIKLPVPIPVHVVYLTVEPDASAPGGFAAFGDIYGEDRREARAGTLPSENPPSRP